MYIVRCRQLPLIKAKGDSVDRTDDLSEAKASPLMQRDSGTCPLDQLDIGHLHEFTEIKLMECAA